MYDFNVPLPGKTKPSKFSWLVEKILGLPEEGASLLIEDIPKAKIHTMISRLKRAGRIKFDITTRTVEKNGKTAVRIWRTS